MGAGVCTAALAVVAAPRGGALRFRGDGAQVCGRSRQRGAHSGAPGRTGRCCTLDDLADARRVAWALEIRHYVLNLEDEFRRDVVRPFVASYLAEVVRAGLQALPKGQTEAAYALGLSYLQTTKVILLPQALRAVIPALVNLGIGVLLRPPLVSVI